MDLSFNFETFSQMDKGPLKCCFLMFAFPELRLVTKIHTFEHRQINVEIVPILLFGARDI